MSHQPDDIRGYIRLTESSLTSRLDDDKLFEDIDVVDSIEVVDVVDSDPLLEDVSDIVFKLRSYTENEGSEDYIRGIEEGLALAANMLERLLERHPGYSSK